MATCNYTVSLTFTPSVDPSVVTLQCLYQDGTLDSVTYDFTNPTELANAIQQVEDAITGSGGVVDTADITASGGDFLVDFTYHYVDQTDGCVMGIMFDSQFPAAAEVICEEEACPEPEPDPITQCAECITVERAACAAAYTFTAGLTASTDYVAVLSDHFGRQYTQDITSGVDGDFTIDATGDFPLGFWTPENSPIEIWVRESVNDTNEAITVSSTEYPCIKLNLVYRDDANPIVLTMFITTDYGIPITNDSGEELLDE